MCVQCMVGAVGVTAGASGLRAWLATRRWMRPAVLKRVTLALLAVVLIASSLLVGGSGGSSTRDARSEIEAPA